MSFADPNQPPTDRIPTENQYNSPPPPVFPAQQGPYFMQPPPLPMNVPYGQQPFVTYQVSDRVDRQVSQIPLLSLISGIVAWPFLCTAGVTFALPIISFLIAIGSVVLGHIGLTRTPTTGMSRGSGLAIAGLIIGYLTLSICIVWAILRFQYYGLNS